jgi:hypothetical protein
MSFWSLVHQAASDVTTAANHQHQHQILNGGDVCSQVAARTSRTAKRISD